MLTTYDRCCIAGAKPVVEELRRAACLTDAALIEMRRERELEKAVLVGMPSVKEQREIVSFLDQAAALTPDDLTLHASLAWCVEHGLIEDGVSHFS